jgi:hypothetical protein
MSVVETAPTRLLDGLRADGRPVLVAEHLEQHGPLPLELRPEELRRRIAESGLTGRGGAGFPTAAKLESVLGGRTRPIVVANGPIASSPERRPRSCSS